MCVCVYVFVFVFVREGRGAPVHMCVYECARARTCMLCVSDPERERERAI